MEQNETKWNKIEQNLNGTKQKKRSKTEKSKTEKNEKKQNKTREKIGMEQNGTIDRKETEQEKVGFCY